MKKLISILFAVGLIVAVSGCIQNEETQEDFSCIPNDYRCHESNNGNKLLQYCNSEGTEWVTEAICYYGCSVIRTPINDTSTELNITCLRSKPKLTESACKEEGVLFGFKHIAEECRNIQIAVCKDMDSEKLISSSYRAADCFYHMAEDYRDESLCDYIMGLKYIESDTYWLCEASTTSDENYCAYIERASTLQLCLSKVG